MGTEMEIDTCRLPSEAYLNQKTGETEDSSSPLLLYLCPPVSLLLLPSTVRSLSVSLPLILLSKVKRG